MTMLSTRTMNNNRTIQITMYDNGNSKNYVSRASENKHVVLQILITAVFYYKKVIKNFL